MKKISPIHAFFAGLCLIIAIALVFLWVKSGTQKIDPVPPTLTPVTDTPFAGPYLLTDHTGKPATDQSWPGKYKLIYFGFTYCPAICPTELQKITYALNAMGSKADIIQPIFITVDPERDTPQKMKDYVAMFHPRLVGLTGTREQVDAALKTFKIYAAKRQDPGASDYTMDHSAFTYFIAPDDRLLTVFKTSDSGDDMIKTMSQWLDQEQLR